MAAAVEYSEALRAYMDKKGRHDVVVETYVPRS